MIPIAAVGRAYGLGRLAIGTALVVAPSLGARLLAEPGARQSVRLLGVRDVLLGVDALLASPGSRSWRRAMALGAAGDAADAIVSAIRFRRTRRASAALMAAAGTAGAAVGLWASVARPQGAGITPPP